jgi:hypothetical protein
MDGYAEQDCYTCKVPHLVPSWHVPFKEHCEENGCRQLVVEKFTGLDNEPDINEEIENG